MKRATLFFGAALVLGAIFSMSMIGAIAQTTPDCSGIAMAAFDIQPGNRENIIHEDGFGWTTTAIFSRFDFNAPACLDLDDFTFGRTGDEESLRLCGVVDFNRDTFPDVLCDFTTLQAGFMAGDMTGTIKGAYFTDALLTQTAAFEKSDMVMIVPTRRSRQICCSMTPIKALQLGNDIYFAAQEGGVNALKVEIFNIQGQEIYKSDSTPGKATRWNLRTTQGTRVANGVYFYVITVHGTDGSFNRAVGKIAVVR